MPVNKELCSVLCVFDISTGSIVSTLTSKYKKNYSCDFPLVKKVLSL